MGGESSALEETVLRLAEPLAASMGLAVVDVRFGRRAGRGVLEVCLDRARVDAGFPPREETGGPSRDVPAAAIPGGPREGTDRRAGVTLDECEAFSRRLSVLLDVEDPVRGSYVLEVASPGLDRVLRRAREFDHFRGRRVRLRVAATGGLVPAGVAGLPAGGGESRRVVVGELLGLVGGRVLVRDDDGQEWEVPLEQVARAELVPELR